MEHLSWAGGLGVRRLPSTVGWCGVALRSTPFTEIDCVVSLLSCQEAHGKLLNTLVEQEGSNIRGGM